MLVTDHPSHLTRKYKRLENPSKPHPKFTYMALGESSESFERERQGASMQYLVIGQHTLEREA